jgi:formylglycine-generating enzyme required for sulfatase activity
MRWFHCTWVCALFVCQFAAAEGRKLAVVVGADEYRPKSDLPSLRHAGSDAALLSTALRGQGYTVFELTVATASQPRQGHLSPQLEYVRDQIAGVLGSPNLGPEDAVVISLHGHGVQFDARNAAGEDIPQFYFCPADATVAGVQTARDLTDRNRLLPLDELYDQLGRCKAGTKLLIVDACRNDPTRSTIFRSSLASATLPKVAAPPGGTAAFFSCMADQRAIEDPMLEQGVFTHFLVQGLNGAADQPLANGPADGVITFAELSAFVANNTYAHVFKNYSVEQSPELRGELDLNLPLARVLRRALEQTITSSIGLELTLIPAGEFLMGSPALETDRSEHEGPQHRVRITQPFYMGTYEVTQAEWQAVMGSNPSWFSSTGIGKEKVAGLDTSRCPVEMVTWFDAIEFCNRLSQRDGLSPYYQLSNTEAESTDEARDPIIAGNVSVLGGNGYRLPTEAEWEYACRAGTTTPFHFGSTNNGAQANIDGNYPYGTATKGPYLVRTTSVGKYVANAFGLSDMHGNVWEWCFDRYDETAYSSRSGTTSDPVVTSSAEDRRVLRGGSWNNYARNSRSAKRFWSSPDLRDIDVGFRVAWTP